MAQPKSRVPLILGLTAAGGVGYYLYSAGGSPKVAEKQFEADVAKASAQVKSQLPGKGNEAQKTAEKWGHEAGAKVDATADQIKAEFNKAEGKLGEYKKDLAKEAQAKIDAADRKVEDATAKAKSGISSWFGK